MKKLNMIIVASAIFLCACKQKPVQSNYQVIPLPQEISMQNGESFILNKTTAITYPAGNEKMFKNAQFLAEYIAESTGYILPIAEQTNRKSIVLELGLESKNFEAYQLTVTNENIIINLDDNTMTIHTEKGRGIIENGDDFTVPEIYNYLKPNEINKYDFYSALYELCGVFLLADCVFETISINNEKKSVVDIHFS